MFRPYLDATGVDCDIIDTSYPCYFAYQAIFLAMNCNIRSDVDQPSCQRKWKQKDGGGHACGHRAFYRPEVTDRESVEARRRKKKACEEDCDCPIKM